MSRMVSFVQLQLLSVVSLFLVVIVVRPSGLFIIALLVPIEQAVLVRFDAFSTIQWY